MIFFSQ